MLLNKSEDVDVVCAIEEQQLDCLLIQACDIQKATMQDPVLSQVYSYTLNGWPTSSKALPDKIKPFFNKRFELTINNRCSLWAVRVVVPDKFHSDILHLLHDGHPGMTKMKSLARLHVWWPGIDEKIEQFVKTCTSCSQNARDQSKYHYTNGKFLLSHGSVSMSTLQDRLRIRCGSWLWMHLASGLKSTLWRQQQLKPPSSILDRFLQHTGCQTDCL